MSHDIEAESWLPIPGWEGWYEVSDLGRVRSVDRWVSYSDGRKRFYPGQVLSQQGARQGRHPQVCLCRNKKYTFREVHSLVLEAFEGPRTPGLECCHYDGDPSNNKLSNLRWDTRSANSLDAVRHGTHGMGRKVRCPQGHELVEPNLVACSLLEGARACLACNRARSRRQKAKAASRPFDFQTVSDAIYAEIMAAASAVETSAADHAGSGTDTGHREPRSLRAPC